MVVGEPENLPFSGSSSSTAEKGGRLICPPCRGQFYSIIADRDGGPRHDDCVNFWTIGNTTELIKREEPIKACACQHKKSWNFSVVKDSNGDSSKS
jgi:hypothetical protein